MSLAEGGCGALAFGKIAQHLTHFIKRPAQIDRCRPGFVQPLPGIVESRIGGITLHFDGDAIGGSSADQRRAAHPHVPDRCREFVERVEFDHPEFVRQPALVNDPDLCRLTIKPDRPVICIANLHS